MTGHGSFGTFTKRIQKSENDLCHACDVRDSPEHDYAECARWEEERRSATERMGTFPPLDGLIPCMLEDLNSWEIMFGFVVDIMTRKEAEDRKRQEGNI